MKDYLRYKGAGRIGQFPLLYCVELVEAMPLVGQHSLGNKVILDDPDVFSGQNHNSFPFVIPVTDPRSRKNSFRGNFSCVSELTLLEASFRRFQSHLSVLEGFCDTQQLLPQKFRPGN